jgi:hypothetical protein
MPCDTQVCIADTADPAVTIARLVLRNHGRSTGNLSLLRCLESFHTDPLSSHKVPAITRLPSPPSAILSLCDLPPPCHSYLIQTFHLLFSSIFFVVLGLWSFKNDVHTVPFALTAQYTLVVTN